jgi:dsDNA-specific endonuclease/ATPase MutS2
MNGCVEFDEETLKPLYRLQIGRSGKSQGIVVAERLGIPAEIIEKAKAMAAQGDSLRGQPQFDIPTGEEAAQRIAPPDTVLKMPAAVQAEQERPPQEPLPREKQFLLGDSVFVTSVNDKGRVAREADEKGDLVVLVRGQRINVNRKRVRLLVKREDLYPDLPNYDLRIVLTSKEDRKLDNAMSKRPVDGVRVIPTDPK